MPDHSKKDKHLEKIEAEPSTVSEFSVLAAFRSGPLPPVAEMEKYEILYPGATKLLLDNFVFQTCHRIELEKAVIHSDIVKADKAQRNSFIIMLSIILMASGLFFIGKDGYAIAAVLSAMTSIIIAFISSSVSRKKEREKKKDVLFK